jgi:hypothetical protein
VHEDGGRAHEAGFFFPVAVFRGVTLVLVRFVAAALVAAFGAALAAGFAAACDALVAAFLAGFAAVAGFLAGLVAAARRAGSRQIRVRIGGRASRPFSPVTADSESA